LIGRAAAEPPATAKEGLTTRALALGLTMGAVAMA